MDVLKIAKVFQSLLLLKKIFQQLVAPLLRLLMTSTVQASTQQDVNVTLSGTEGIRVLRMWARDAAGNISSTSQDVSIVLDRVSPSLTLTSLDGGQALRGGKCSAITWTTTRVKSCYESHQP
jgi:hypothetical protein